MGSILLILVITIIAFVSLADFVQFCTEPLVLQSTFHQHGICNQKAGAKAAKGYSPQTVVFTSERVSGFDSEPNPKPQAAPSETPFEGSYIPCPTIQSDGDFQFASMEMPPVQANLFGKTRMLCSMWSALESLLGPRLCGTSPQASRKDKFSGDKTTGIWRKTGQQTNGFSHRADANPRGGDPRSLLHGAMPPKAKDEEALPKPSQAMDHSLHRLCHRWSRHGGLGWRPRQPPTLLPLTMQPTSNTRRTKRERRI